ncbi:MAG: VWA domain-containing protein [Candidatus Lokiarchaeota archaeon]|nr:VWA domain-containing protein [Candidatus Lokiarchaeota archaeon]
MSKSRKKRIKIIPTKDLNRKEQHLIELAKIAWDKTQKAFYFPPLDLPTFVFDYTHLEGFYIDPQNKWKISMNLANAPIFIDDQEYVNYFHAISLHEVSHYQIIPYDGLINARLLKAAMKNVNENFAPIVVNVFADLIIDAKLHKKEPDLIAWELKTTFNHLFERNKNKLSEFSKFLFRAYEKILNIKIVDSDLFTSVESVAEKVVNIIKKNFEDETLWEEKVSKVAYHLRTLVNNTFTMVGAGVHKGEGNTRRKTSGRSSSTVEFPEDILEIMDDPLENKNLDKLKEDNEEELRQKAEEFAKETPYSDYGAPAGQAGILIDGNPLTTWYRGLAKDLIEIKIFEEKPGGQLPVFPEVWHLGEPIEDLDIVQTILNSPIIIPNITTRKWLKNYGKGHLTEKQIPDLLLVLDSSGSMNWNYLAKSSRGVYHTALVASFAALHFAAKKGVKFSVINFSNRADVCDWTVDYKKAERTLLRYQGGGTHLPIKDIVKQTEKSERDTLIFIITDFGIYNWNSAKKLFSNLSNKGHKIVGFFIGSAKIPKEKFKDLLEKATFYPIKNPKDLINLVIKEVKKYYLA